MSVAIEFNHIGKQYRLGLVSTRTLSHDLNRWWAVNVRHKEDPYLKIGSVNDRSKAADSEYVWALRDIDFKIEQGEVVGIIGRNGAGKSTLLKLLSKVTGPTVGTIRARGRIGSLLEVGTGFHSEMTGRENIYMNGAILGMTKPEISRKLDEIVDFSGCERYLDTPVKRYSSGMMVRLGFAVAAHLDPEILVVDEVLAVGDAEFQKKAIGKMQDVSHSEGRTVLFVSHNMASIRALCNRGVVLQNGTQVYDGDVAQAIDYYMTSCVDQQEGQSVRDLPRSFKCSGKVRLVAVDYLDKDGESVTPHCGAYTAMRFTVEAAEDVKNVQVSVTINDNYGAVLTNCPSAMTTDLFSMDKGTHHFDLVFERLPFTEGIYRLNFWCAVANERADFIQDAIKMQVADDDYYGRGRQFAPHIRGKIVLCHHNWTLDK